MNDSSCTYEIIDVTLKSGCCSLSVSRLCDLAGVYRSGYYAWKKYNLVCPIRKAERKSPGFIRKGLSCAMRSADFLLLDENPDLKAVYIDGKRVDRPVNQHSGIS